MTRLVHGILIGAWIVIGLNLLLAFGAIGVFARMAPAIAIILDQNDRSLEASEEMLAALALRSNEPSSDALLQDRFQEALDVASGNVTESGEQPALAGIAEHYPGAFSGDNDAVEQTIHAIESLIEINRQAMIRADARAKSLGRAGGWSVAIMAGVALTVSLVLLRLLNRTLIAPLKEIHDTVTAYLAGDERRRCFVGSANRDLKSLGHAINAILDRAQPSGERAVESASAYRTENLTES